MQNKKLYILLLMFLLGGINLHAEKSDLAKNNTNIVDVLDDVYKQVCDYNKDESEFPSVFEHSIGRIIQLRMWYILAIALFISLAYKTILVIGDPKQEFSKYMFLKPLMLVLFLTFYPFSMGIVNSIMEHLTFKDIARKSVRVTAEIEDLADVGYFRVWTIKDNLSALFGGGPEDIPENATFEEVLTDPQLMREIELREAIANAKKTGNKLSQDEMDEIKMKVEQDAEGRGAIQVFQSITFWLGDKISIIMRIIQTVLLSILFVGGPIAIVAEVIFPGSLKKWFGIFIHTHLWTPVIFLIDIVSALINNALEKVDQGTASIIAFVVSVVIIALYIIVSKIASNFIQSQEGGGVLGAMSYKTLQYLRAGSQSILGGSGAISGAFKGTLGKK